MASAQRDSSADIVSRLIARPQYIAPLKLRANLFRLNIAYTQHFQNALTLAHDQLVRRNDPNYFTYRPFYCICKLVGNK